MRTIFSNFNCSSLGVFLKADPVELNNSFTVGEPKNLLSYNSNNDTSGRFTICKCSQINISLRVEAEVRTLS